MMQSAVTLGEERPTPSTITHTLYCKLYNQANITFISLFQVIISLQFCSNEWSNQEVTGILSNECVALISGGVRSADVRTDSGSF